MEHTQVNIFETPIPAPASDTEQVYHADDFACCSLFYQCSDAKRCLACPERAANCYYRHHLEAGRIFYGKNADSFSRTRYDQLLKQVDSLSTDARSALDGILIEFLEYRRGIRQSVVWNRCIDELASLHLFSFRPLGEDFPPPAADLSKMYALIEGAGGGPAFELAKAKRTAERKPLLDALAAAKKNGDKAEESRLKKERAKIDEEKPGPRTWGFLREWLNGEAVELRDRLASPYCLATLPTDQIPYTEELYRDTLKKSYWTRIYPPTPYAQDGLLSAAKWKEEEQRRVQLSRGYSQEEKDCLMAGEAVGAV